MSISNALQQVLQQEIHKRSLPDNFMHTVLHWYLPVAEQIMLAKKNTQQTLLVSFNGSQGSGKSTITAFLRLILIHQFEFNTVEVSIDDFYLTHHDRQQLAKNIHPLFATRGVPGTHDIQLAVNTINCLRSCTQQSPCAVPQFDKAIDDRKPEAQWPLVNEPVDVILFEGWCNHAPLSTAAQLEQPVNDLERNEDAEGIWRSYSNRQLAEYHRLLFDRAELLIHLKAPSFEKVYEWRGLQEKKLEKDAGVDNHAVMNEQQLQRFIQHYERITRLCLQQLPELADIVLTLNDQHAIESILLKSSECENV